MENVNVVVMVKVNIIWFLIVHTSTNSASLSWTTPFEPPQGTLKLNTHLCIYIYAHKGGHATAQATSDIVAQVALSKE